MSTQTLPATTTVPVVNVEVVHRLIENRVAQLNEANLFEARVAELLTGDAYQQLEAAKKLHALEGVLREYRAAKAPLIVAGKLLEDIAIGG